MAQALTRVSRFTFSTFTFAEFTFAAFTTLSALTTLAAFTLADEGTARAQAVQPNAEPPIGSIYGGLPAAGDSTIGTGGTAPASSTAPESPTSPQSTATPQTAAAPPAPPIPGVVEAPPQLAPEPVAPEHVAVEHQHPVPSGQGRRGFVVAASFGVRPTFASQLSAGAVSTSMTTALQGGLAFGLKTGRVVLTLGLDLGAIDVRDSFTYRTTATFLIVPGLQVALLRSKDHRVELVGSLRIGAGSTMTTDASSTLKTPALVMYEIAPAVRYWAHKQFALQFLAGYGGEYTIVSGGGGNTSTGQHGLSAAIGTVGIF